MVACGGGGLGKDFPRKCQAPSGPGGRETYPTKPSRGPARTKSALPAPQGPGARRGGFAARASKGSLSRSPAPAGNLVLGFEFHVDPGRFQESSAPVPEIGEISRSKGCGRDMGGHGRDRGECGKAPENHQKATGNISVGWDTI